MPLSAPLSSPGAPRAKRFGRVRVLTDLDEADAAWSALGDLGATSPYQTLAFLRAWLATLGQDEGVSPFVILAEDDDGRPSAVLPLGIVRGALRRAVFLGGKQVNSNLGLFRGPWTPADLMDLLREAGRGRIDLYALKNMPRAWNGVDNPLAQLDSIDAPSSNFSTSLSIYFEQWFNSRTSKDARKKWRKKRQGLEKVGPVAFTRAETADQAEAVLSAFLGQRAERASDGLPNAYSRPSAVAFVRRLAGLDAPVFVPTLRLYGLRCGAAFAATFGALDEGGHLSGMLTSFSADPALARFSPGELLLHDVIARASAEGRKGLDLGIGDGRYKRETCETEVPLVEAYVPLTAAGALAAQAERWRSGVKRGLKANPRAMDLLRRLRAIVARRDSRTPND